MVVMAQHQVGFALLGFGEAGLYGITVRYARDFHKIGARRAVVILAGNLDKPDDSLIAALFARNLVDGNRGVLRQLPFGSSGRAVFNGARYKMNIAAGIKANQNAA